MKDWQVTFWDVGQGDASDILLPDGQHILIDAGPLLHKGNPLPQWFVDNSPQPIKLAIVTHNHVDHFGGFVTLASSQEQEIERFILLPDKLATKIPLQKSFDELLTALKARVQSGRTTVEWAKSPQVLYSDGALQLRMLHPLGLTTPTRLDVNKTSMVLALETLTPTPRALVVWAADTLLKNVCTVCAGSSPCVLMGPHHGKAQDKLSAPGFWKIFNTELHPDCIFVSVGRGNTYNHPDRKYIVGAASAKIRVCCSEISDHCDKFPAMSIYPGSAMLGLPQPPATYQCRGAMRIFVSSNGVSFDEHQTAYLAEVAKVYPDAPCKLMRFAASAE